MNLIPQQWFLLPSVKNIFFEQILILNRVVKASLHIMNCFEQDFSFTGQCVVGEHYAFSVCWIQGRFCYLNFERNLMVWAHTLERVDL